MVYMYAGFYLHLEGKTVAAFLRTGRSLRTFPLLAEAYREGAISACKVREITRVATKETEAYWLEIARTSTYRQIEKMVVFSPRPSRLGETKTNEHYPAGSEGQETDPTTGLTAQKSSPANPSPNRSNRSRVKSFV